MSKANTVCIDFDKTLCSDDKFGEPNKDVVELVKKLYFDRYSIIIYTSRSDAFQSKIYNWLLEHNLFNMIDHVYWNKPEAVVYLDDRALRYNKEQGFNGEQRVEYIKEESENLLKLWVSEHERAKNGENKNEDKCTIESCFE